MFKINQNLIQLTLLIIISVLMWSCQEEELVQKDYESEPIASFVTPQKDLNLKNRITKLHNRKIENGRYVGILNKLDTEKVLKVETDSSVSYSFNINEPNYYANLIVWQHEGESYTFLQEFEPNDRFLKYLSETDATDFSNFSGTINIRNLDGKLIATNTLKDGNDKGSNSNERSLTGCSEVGYEWIDMKIVRIVIVYSECDDISGAGGWSGSDDPAGGGTSGDGDNDGIPCGGSPITGHDPSALEKMKADLWEESIDDSDLEPCMKDEFNSLKSLETDLGSFINQMDNSKFFNWELKDKAIIDYGEGQTYAYTEINLNKDGALTFFDSNKLNYGSDIGIAAVILHEAMHAYLHFNYRDENISKEYIDLFERHYSEKAEHEQWVINDFIQNMALTLKSFGDSQGYGYGIDFYTKIAWGGLKDTDAYANRLSSEMKNEIDDAVKIELTGKNANGVSKNQKGGNGDC